MADSKRKIDSLMRCFLFLLVLTECFLISSTASQIGPIRQILATQNQACGGKFRLSAQTDAYKITFPSCDECEDCPKNMFPCVMRFISDPFTIKMFDVCIDESKQTMTDCVDVPITYQIGSNKPVTVCNIVPNRNPPRCMRLDKRIELTIPSPCSIQGQTMIYLKPRNQHSFTLFKENRQCRPHSYFVKDEGTIISQFQHQYQDSPDFCPMLLNVWNWMHYGQFCFWFEFGEFPKSDFSIRVFSLDGKKQWIINNSIRINKTFCDRVRPDGYKVSPNVAHQIELNNHRAVMKYHYTPREYYKKNVDNEDENNEDAYDYFSLSSEAIILMVIVLTMVGLGFCFCYCLCKRVNRQRRPPEVGRDSDRQRLNYPSATRVAGASANTESPTIATPSAPLMNGSNGLAEPPPSYESLFPPKIE